LQLNLGRLANGKLAVTLDSPDEGQVGIAATLVHRSRGVYLGLQWQGVGYSFEGKMSGNRCSGTWREKGVAVPLVFERIKPTP
jgi:hypothetical protein